jgi:phosphoserine phosphatase
MFYDIVIFDCDSTLTEIEGIDTLARFIRKEKEVARLTDGAMNGDASFEYIFPKRLDLISPRREHLDLLGREYIKRRVNNARSVIKALHNLDKEVFIISGGYTQAISIFAAYLGVPQSNLLAIDLKFDRKGNYLGYNKSSPLVKNDGKSLVLQQLKLQRKASMLFVGDGVTDLLAKDVVDLFVGFGGVKVRDKVKKEAEVFITDLQQVIDIVQGKA